MSVWPTPRPDARPACVTGIRDTTALTDAPAAPSGTGDSGGSFTRLSGIIHSGNVRGCTETRPRHGVASTPFGHPACGRRVEPDVDSPRAHPPGEAVRHPSDSGPPGPRMALRTSSSRLTNFIPDNYFFGLLLCRIYRRLGARCSS